MGDAFDIDYVAHEMGHQFGGNHPFNGDAGSCAGGNRNATTAWEPGSGSTIMAYAGICGSANNLQPNSDPTSTPATTRRCGLSLMARPAAPATATGNTAPVVTAPASGKTLPIGTPFKLTATATDAENDALTYLWEEMDLGPSAARQRRAGGQPERAPVPLVCAHGFAHALLSAPDRPAEQHHGARRAPAHRDAHAEVPVHGPRPAQRPGRRNRRRQLQLACDAERDAAPPAPSW